MFDVRMPFDWKTPIGYATTTAIQLGTWIFLLSSCSCILAFMGGVCWLLIAFAEDIRKDIQNLNEERSNNAVLKTKLKNVIEFHYTTKQLSVNLKISNENEINETSFVFRLINDFSEIYEFIITGYYLWSISTIGCSLFLVLVGTVE